MYIARSQLARICTQHNEPLPEFWFPDNEKYPYKVTGDISDEATVDGRYKLAMIYDDTAQLSGDPSNDPPIATTVNSNAVKAAQASHAPINEIKSRFICFYEEKCHDFPSKRAVAKSFYDSLHDKQEKLLFLHEDAAVRTLLDALRDYMKLAK